MLACAAAPAPDATWELSLHGRPVGVVRAWWTPAGAVRERLLRVEADGEVHERRTRVTVRLGADGAVDAWRVERPEGAASGVGPAWDPWIAPPPAGEVPLLDEATASLEVRRVTRAGERLSWDTPAGPVTVTLQGGLPAEGRWAGTSFRRGPADLPDPAPLDVAAALSRPAPRLPGARRALVGDWEVGGAPVRVEAPLLDELPPWTAAVGDLARQVAAGLPDGAAPFGGTGSGDCTEHAAAFVAAARAAGWEVRPAVGWLYVAEPTPRLWLHAWAEVRVGERWVGADPTLGQFPADAAHLRVGAGTWDLAAADGVDVTIRDLR